MHSIRPLPDSRVDQADEPALLLVTPEDLHPESLFPVAAPIAGALIAQDPAWQWGELAHRFVACAAADTAARVSEHFRCSAEICATPDASAVIQAAQALGVRRVVTPYAPVGPVADWLTRLKPQLAAQGTGLASCRRAWDQQFWPHATKGFFPFKERMPDLLRGLGLPAG